MSDCTTVIEQECGKTYLEGDNNRTLIEEGCEQVILESCRQGPSGPPGGNSVCFPDPVAPSTTEVIDSVDITEFLGCKWFIHFITDEPTPRYRAIEVYATHNGVTSFYNVTNNIGELIGLNVVADLNGGNLELQVTNSDTVDIQVRYLRMAFCV